MNYHLNFYRTMGDFPQPTFHYDYKITESNAKDANLVIDGKHYSVKPVEHNGDPQTDKFWNPPNDYLVLNHLQNHKYKDITEMKEHLNELGCASVRITPVKEK